MFFVKLIRSINFGRILFAMVLALVVWGYVILTIYPQRDKDFSLALDSTTRKPTNTLGIRSVGVEQIKLSVYGPEDKVNSYVQPSTPYLDLSQVKAPGVIEVPVKIDGIPSGLGVSIQPDKVQVTIEKREQKRLTINISLVGTPVDGYLQPTPDQFTLSEDNVDMEGYESDLRKVVGARVEVNADKPNVFQSKPIVLLDSNSQPITNTNGIKVTPGFVFVSGNLTPVGTSQQKPIRVATTGTPATGYVISGIVVSPDSARVTGDRSIIEKLAQIDTEPVDINGRKDPIQDLEVNLIPPPNVGILGVDDSGKLKVKVSIQFAPVNSSITIIKKVEAANANNRYRYDFDPPNVGIVLSAPYETFAGQTNGFNISTITATVDIAQFTQPGRFSNIAVKVEVPPGFTVVNKPTVTANIVQQATAAPQPTARPPTATPAPSTLPPTTVPAPTTAPPSQNDPPETTPPLTTAPSLGGGATNPPTAAPEPANPTPSPQPTARPTAPSSPGPSPTLPTVKPRQIWPL